jgi:hypothetical protein
MIKFPFFVNELSDSSSETFNSFYAQPYRGIERNNLEGMWFRTQNQFNKDYSKWENPDDKRRRIIYFRDKYNTKKLSNKNWLILESAFMYVSNTLPSQEIDEYLYLIKQELENYECKQIEENYEVYKKDDIIVEIKNYERHPKDIIEDREFPKEYRSLDIVIRSSNLDIKNDMIDKPWNLFKKGIRSPGIKGNPRYNDDIKEIEKYLPAQIELGCGPSIESNIPALHSLHEIYRVQNRKGEFYIGPYNDDLIVNILKDTKNMYMKFTQMFKKCVEAQPSESHKIIKELFDKNIFVGEILSNNFDMLCERVGVKERLLRTYEPEKFFPTIEFDKAAKSLLVIGSHADRKHIQLQARLKGLKVIHLDPEGYLTDGVFNDYPLEAPKDGDLVIRKTAREGLEQIKKYVDSLVLS